MVTMMILLCAMLANDFHDVLGVFRGEPGGRFVEKINVRHPDHIETDVESFSLAAAERFLLRAADHCVASFAQAELDQFCLQTPGAIAPRQVRRANRRRKLQIFADGQMFVERVLLRHVTDVALQRVEIWIKRLAIEQDLAAGGLKLPGQHLSAACFFREPLAPITQTSSPRVDTKGNSFETDLAVAEAMRDFAHLERANDVALFFDDSLGKIAPQKLADVDSNGVAIL